MYVNNAFAYFAILCAHSMLLPWSKFRDGGPTLREVVCAAICSLPAALASTSGGDSAARTEHAAHCAGDGAAASTAASFREVLGGQVRTTKAVVRLLIGRGVGGRSAIYTGRI